MSSLTICDLQQGLGDDGASDVEGLAAVVSPVRALGVCDGQVPRLGDRQAGGGLGRLVGKQQVLNREGKECVRKRERLDFFECRSVYLP